MAPRYQRLEQSKEEDKRDQLHSKKSKQHYIFVYIGFHFGFVNYWLGLLIEIYSKSDCLYC